MYTKFFKLSIAALAIITFLSGHRVVAQDTLYDEKFDSSTVNLPAGWIAASTDTVGWTLDSVSSNSSNNTYASGLSNVVCKNQNGDATDTLTSRSVSTIGHDNISVLWDARFSSHFADSGSFIQSFAWTKDNGMTWSNLTYTENTPVSGSPWMWENDSTRIPLPDSASNQAAIKFRWIAHLVFDANGTYRIDDFTVMGDTSSAGIKEIHNNSLPILAMQASNLLNIRMNDFSTGKVHVSITNIDGSLVYNSMIAPVNQTIDLNGMASGIYLISFKATEGVFDQKLLISH